MLSSEDIFLQESFLLYYATGDVKKKRVPADGHSPDLQPLLNFLSSSSKVQGAPKDASAKSRIIVQIPTGGKGEPYSQFLHFPSDSGEEPV